MQENSSGTRTAWMIRNDGAEIPVITHIYADKEEIDEVLAAAYFLWENDVADRETVREFLDNWAFKMFSEGMRAKHLGFDFIQEGLAEYLRTKPYYIFPQDFMETVAMNAILTAQTRKVRLADIPVDGTELIATLNQRFLRVRYGGRYDTVPGCGDMFFRVSSVGFDWFPIIRNSVLKSAFDVATVTIVRDFESTGCEKYYVDTENRAYNRIPIAEFLSSHAKTTYPLVSSRSSGSSFSLSVRVAESLANGASIQQLRTLPANFGRIRDSLQLLKHREEIGLADE